MRGLAAIVSAIGSSIGSSAPVASAGSCGVPFLHKRTMPYGPLQAMWANSVTVFRPVRRPGREVPTPVLKVKHCYGGLRLAFTKAACAHGAAPKVRSRMPVAMVHGMEIGRELSMRS